jgi:hypothetical protein
MLRQREIFVFGIAAVNVDFLFGQVLYWRILKFCLLATRHRILSTWKYIYVFRFERRTHF